MAEATATTTTPVPISLKEFLEKTPPGAWALVTDISSHPSRGESYSRLQAVDLELHCSNAKCDGTLFFKSANNCDVAPGWNYEFVHYRCKNCEELVKTFAIIVVLKEDFVNGEVFKYGEMPGFGPPTPKK